MDNNYSKDDFYIALAGRVGERTTCIRRKVGAVLVKDDEIISMGTNGAPEALGQCESCYRVDNNIPSGLMLDHCYAIHGEPHALMNALMNGKDPKGSTIYLTTTPCINCAKLLIFSGIKRIVCSSIYNDEFSLETIKKAGIELDVIKPKFELDSSWDVLINKFIEECGPKLTRFKE